MKDDLIRRQTAIGIVIPALDGANAKTVERLLNLVPAASERGEGGWICSDDLYETAICSCCGWDSGETWEHIYAQYWYCPNCGASMTKEDNAK